MKDNKTLIVNLFGAPGTGKSTMAAQLFAMLKWKDINCELVPEYAKIKVWDNHLDALNNQIYIFGKQHNAIYRLLGKVDVVITDSPILMQLCYTENVALRALIRQEHFRMNNLNILLNRTKKYNPKGRVQTEAGSDAKAVEILDMVNRNLFTDFHVYPAKEDKVEEIFNLILEKIV